MHEVMMTLNEIKEIEKTLLSWMKEETSKGKECFDVEAAGEVVDMIKDLSEASEKCMKKKYYEMLICDMMRSDDDMEEEGRMGYDHWRYSGSGHYAPKGRGTYSSRVTGNTKAGYVPDPDFDDWTKKPGRHIHAPYLYDDNMGPMGYPMNDRTRMETDRRSSKYGEAYDRYRDTKKYYTETHDEESKQEMNEHIKESARDTLTAMKDMWQDATPEVKQSMRSGMETLLNEMKKG